MQLYFIAPGFFRVSLKKRGIGKNIVFVLFVVIFPCSIFALNYVEIHSTLTHG